MSLAILTRKQSFVRFQQKKFVAVAWNLFPCPLSLRKPLGRLKMAASICKNRKNPYITRDVYELSKTSKMELFPNIVDYIQPLTIFTKHSILGVLQGRCASGKTKEKLGVLLFIS